MRVVFADDSPVFRDQWMGYFKSLGHTVVGAAVNGREAIDLCRKFKPDLVMLDMSMPVLGGDMAALEIRNAKTAKHILIASSLSSEKKRSEELGFGFITKPICSPQTLALKIAQVCGG